MSLSREERARVEAYEARLGDALDEATGISMWEMLRRSAELHPDRPALRADDGDVRYAELVARSLRCAARLEALGVRKGTRVSMFFHVCVEWAVAHYGLMRLGAVVVPINSAYEADEVRWVLERGESELVVSPTAALGLDFAGKLAAVDAGLVHGDVAVPGLPSLRRVHLLPTENDRVRSGTKPYVELYGEDGEPGLAPLGPTVGGDPGYVLFTSGSTAHPKPALCRSGAYVGCAVALCHSLGIEPGDTYTAYNPTFHSSGVIWNLTMPHAVGAAGYILPKFDGRTVLDLITERKVTHAGAFDTMVTMMMATHDNRPLDLSHIKGWNLGCTPSFLRRIIDVWSARRIGTIYGSTESSGVASLVPFGVDDPEIRINSNGRPLPGVDVKIVDPETGSERAPDEPGEICFRGWCLFIEYLGMPEEMAASFDADGFFHSGDYGWLDEDGFLYFRGRYKMMIKTGGENVAQREVEIFLEDTLDFVKHAEVVGVPDVNWGEAVVAFVECADGVERSGREMRDVCRGKIANFKIPKHFVTVEPGGWPALGSGRMDKPALQRRANAMDFGSGD